MLDSLFGTGKMEKMTICALMPQKNPKEPAALSTVEEDKYMVQVNPDSYAINHHVNYSRTRVAGTSGSRAKYRDTSPPVLEFTFLFDGTGVIPKPAGPLDGIPVAGAVAGAIAGLLGENEEYDVMTELAKFAFVCYTYKGTGHSPRQVQLTWGKLAFRGVLSSLSLNYKLFKPDGTPLRCEAKAGFSGTIEDMVREAMEKRSSPDLTHVKTVLAGDTLPLLSHGIYGVPDYYIEVARTNKLFNFRKLKEGGNIFFPPAKNSKI